MKVKTETTTAPRSPLNVSSLFWLAWAGIVLVYIVCRFNAVAMPLERDEGLFGYVGQVVLDGGVPYRDAIDHKPPLVYFIYALALQFVSPTAEGVHLFLQVYNFLTLIALFFAAKLYADSVSAGLWAAFCYAIFSSSPAIHGYTASTEMFMLLPLCLSLLCAVAAVKKNALYYVILSGISSALCCWLKHTGVFPALFPVLYLLIAFAKRKDTLQSRIQIVSAVLTRWSCGFFLVSFVIAGYFCCRDAFRDFIYWVFTFNYHYSSVPGFSSIFFLIFSKVTHIAACNPAIMVASFFALGACLWKKDSRGLFIAGFLALSCIATVPGYAYTHYFAQLAPAASFAGGFGFFLVCGHTRNSVQKTIAVLLCALSAAGVPLISDAGFYFLQTPTELSRAYFGANPFPESIDIAEYLQKRTDRTESIFIYGSEAQILFYAQRKSASPFVLLYPLTNKIYPDYLELQERVWRDIIKANPRYILLVNITASTLWDGKADLPLSRNIIQDLGKRYFLEAIMTMDKPKGSLLVTSEITNMNAFVEQMKQRCLISIFRRK